MYKQVNRKFFNSKRSNSCLAALEHCDGAEILICPGDGPWKKEEHCRMIQMLNGKAPTVFYKNFVKLGHEKSTSHSIGLCVPKG